MKKIFLPILFLVLVLLLFTSCDGQDLEEMPSGSTPAPQESVFPDGASIGGADISGMTVEEAISIAKSEMARECREIKIIADFGDDNIQLQGDDFTFTSSLESSVPGYLQTQQAVDFPMPYSAELSPAGKEKLEAALETCQTEGKDATIESFNISTGEFTFVPEEKGKRVNMEKLLKDVNSLLENGQGGTVKAEFIETEPALTEEYLRENFTLISYYTTVSTNNANGNSNMRLALSKVNGTILEPGEIFSYNDALGDSTTPDGGWLPAGGLMQGVSVEMYGGGICQGSTTLYNAAMMAGMEVVFRDCHSRPSSYCPIGLDATVDYGNTDFKFKNPLENPVYIAAWMDGVTLHVNFYGIFPEEWDDILLTSSQTGSEPPLQSVSFMVDSKLQTGQYVRKTSGEYGYTAEAFRTFYKDGVEVRTEELPSSHYPPTGIVYAVGPDTDTEKVDITKKSGDVNAPTPTPAPTPGANTPLPGESPTPYPGEFPPAASPSPEPTVAPPLDPWDGPVF